MWLVEVALACKIEVQICITFGLWNMGKVELQDDLHSVSSYIITSSITYLSWEKKAQLPQEIWSIRFEKKRPRTFKCTNSREHAMNTQPTLHSSSGHLLFPSYYTLRDTSAFVSAPGTSFSCKQFSIVGTNMGRTSKCCLHFCVCSLYYFGYTLIV